MATTAEMIHPTSNRPPDRLRRLALALSLVLVAVMIVNAARAAYQPIAFADYLGLPLRDPRDVGFVHVYALRAAFLGAFGLVLLMLRELRLLAWYALVAMIMPLGDLALTAQAGAPIATVVRHGAIALFLLATAALLFRTSRTRA
jgi:VanZ family protein